MTQALYPRFASDDPRLREILPRVWIGGADARRRRGWAAVVDLRQDARQDAAQHPVLALAMRDGDPFPPGALDRITDFVGLHYANGPVLIHCQSGYSRSMGAGYAVARRAGASHASATGLVALDGDVPANATMTSARQWAARFGTLSQR